jgi:hypothetical protein
MRIHDARRKLFYDFRETVSLTVIVSATVVIARIGITRSAVVIAPISKIVATSIGPEAAAMPITVTIAGINSGRKHNRRPPHGWRSVVGGRGDTARESN